MTKQRVTNYLLSIDPSITNTGFTLWENKKPIWVSSFSFKKYDGQRQFYWNIKVNNNELDIIMERGTFHSKNGIGYETQEHLRGFIAGQFNKLLTKDMLISPKTWQNWYIKKFPTFFENDKKLTKKHSLEIAQIIITENNWNITINNHDEADSLLIGWYFLNKEKNNEN